MKNFTASSLLRTGLLKFTFLLFGFLMMAHLGWSNTRYVDSSVTSGSNNGLSWANAYRYLSDALAAAQTDATIDTILVAEGTYYPTGAQSDTSRSSTFAILRNNLKIFGGFRPDSAYSWSSRVLPVSGNAGSILSGDINLPNDTADNSYHVMVIIAPAGDTIDTAGVYVDGFTITGGNGVNAPDSMTLNGQSFFNRNGAGIYIAAHIAGTATSPSIRNCLLEGNHADWGGGMYQANYNGVVNALIESCIVRGNTATYNGAGIFIQASIGQSVQGKPVIKNTLVADNMARGSGGGIYFNNSIGHLTLNQVTFRNNDAGGGGGVYHQSGKVIADSCAFYSNVATNSGGGGWFNQSDSAIISSVRFIDNIGQNQFCNGGGFRNQGGYVAITNAVFQGNHADTSYGGAWYNHDGKVFMVNALFSGNTADYGGAWFSEKDSSQMITNATFAGNKAVASGASGGAIRTSNNLVYLNIRLRNSIIWGNSSEIDGIVSLSNTIVSGGGSSVLDMNPLFVAPVSFSMAPDTLGDYHLSQCSPAINIGSNDSISAGVLIDLDGNARIMHSIVDLGAYEFQDTIPQYSAVYVDSTNGNDGNDGASWATAFKTLSYALTIVQDTLTACYTDVDSILVAEGTYYPTGAQSDTSRSRSFAILRGGLKIYGGFPSGGGTFAQRQLPTSAVAGSVLSGDIGIAGDSTDNSRHVVIIVGIDAGTDSLILDGFRIQDGFANGTGSTFPKGESLTNSKGAGIYTSRIDTAAMVVINHCVVTNNNAESHGGGIVANNSFFYLLNSSIAQNQSGDLGGGLYDAGGSNLVIRDS